MKTNLTTYLSALCLCLFALLWLSTGLTDPLGKGTPLQSARQLRAHLSTLSSLQFSFTQNTSGQMSGRARAASGTAYLVKDQDGARMRWDYHTPDSQVIISDGITLSMYFEKLKQMIIAPADSIQQDITYQFFTSEGNIEADFIVDDGIRETTTTETSSAYTVIRLTPRSPTTQIKDIHLYFTEKNHIKRLEIRDNFNTLTLLNLSNIEENTLVKNGTPVDDKLFSFTPPEDTEIIHQ